MRGGTLVVSRMVLAHEHIKMRFKKLGFGDVTITAAEKDGLNLVINEIKPSLVVVGCNFYDCCTPFMMGRLLRAFPGLNIAAVSLTGYPADLGMSFIINGVKSYLNFADGPEQFYDGLERIRGGRNYISPDVEERIAVRSDFPRPSRELTDRQMEILRLLCNGYETAEICKTLQISRGTVWYFKDELYNHLAVRNETELSRVAQYLNLIPSDELKFYGGDFQLKPYPDKRLADGGGNDCKNKKQRNHRW